MDRWTFGTVLLDILVVFLMAKPFRQQDYEHDKLCYDTVFKQLKDYFYIEECHKEDYQIDCKVMLRYFDEIAMYLELEHSGVWCPQSANEPYLYPKLNLLKHKVDKYRKLDGIVLYLIFSKDLKHVRITIFKSVERNNPKTFWCRKTEGSYEADFYQINPNAPYTKVIKTDNLERFLLLIAENYLKQKKD